jgi:ABC-2 type transport system ATP-binding protein
MLQFDQVSKAYHHDPVIEIPSLKLDPGIYWLKGVNGSGKTTLLKMIAALVPFKGDISLNDISLRNTPVAYRHQLGWAEAEPLFPPFMTGIELLSLYRDIRKISKKKLSHYWRSSISRRM